MTPDEALRALLRLIFGPWVRLWRGLSTLAQRHVKLALFTTTTLLTTAGAAYAEGSDKPSALSWIGIKDSHGINVWQYEMSLDRGGVTNATRMVWSVLVDICWEIYRAAVAIAAWLIDWTLSFSWLNWVTGPITTIGDSLQSIVDRFGVTNTLLTVSAVAAVVWMARGRWALGVFELFMSLIIASLAVGVLANPVRMVAGNDGLLTGARDTGLQLATGLSNGGDTTASSEEMREGLSGMIVDTFLRRPQQLVNFGRMIDGTKCEDDYQEALEDGPYGSDDDLRDAVGDCNEDAGEVAENPNASMFMSIAILLPAGLVIMIFAAILCIAVLVAGVYALVQSVKMIIALVLALLPGNSRGSLWMTFAELVASMLMIIASVVFLSAYLLFIQAIFDQGGNPMQTFFIVDLMLIVGIVVYWKLRERIKASAARMAQIMSKRPGGGRATSLPGKVAFNPANAYYKGRMALGAASTAAGGAAALGRGYKAASGKAADGVVAGSKWAGSQVGNSLAGIKFASDVASRDAANRAAATRLNDRLGGQQKPSRTGQLASVAVPLALAAATGGTSAVAHQAASQVAIGAARRAALQSKLRPIELGPGPSAQGPSSPKNPGGPGRGPTPPAGPRIQPRPTQAPRVVPGEVVNGNRASDDPAARLRARLAASRTTPMPGSRAIAMPPSRAIPMPAPKPAPKSPGKE